MYVSICGTSPLFKTLTEALALYQECIFKLSIPIIAMLDYISVHWSLGNLITLDINYFKKFELETKLLDLSLGLITYLLLTLK